MEDFHVRRGVHWMVMSLLLAVAGCGGDSGTNGGGGGGAGYGGGGGGGGGTTPVATTSVQVIDDAFNPPNILVPAGATVTWGWTGNALQHNVTFASASIDNSVTQTTGMFQAVMPTAAGVYTYQCTILAGMDGSVVVAL